MFQRTSKLVTRFKGADDLLLGFFLPAADGPVATKPEKYPQQYPQRVQPLALVELRVHLAPQGLAEQVAQNEIGFDEPPVLLQDIGQVNAYGPLTPCMALIFGFNIIMSSMA